MKNESKKIGLSNKAKSGFVWLLSGSTIQSFLQIIFTAILARLLEPSDFGLIASAMVVVGFADLFTQFGVGPALVQTKKLTDEKISTAFAFSLGIGVLLILVFYFINPWIATFFKMPKLLNILNVLILLFPLKSFTQLSYSLLQRNLEFKKIAGLDVISYIIGYGILGLSLAYAGFGVWALVYGILLQNIIYSVLLFWKMPHKLSFRYNHESFKSLFSFGAGFTIVRVLNFFALKGDYIIIGKILGDVNLGFYSRAYALMNAPNNIVGKVLNTVLFASFSEIQSDQRRICNILKKSFEGLVLLCFPLSFFLWLLAPELILILLGEKWVSSIGIFQILVIGLFFRIGYKIGDSFAFGLGKVKEQSIIHFIYLVNVIIGAIIGSLSFGINGVAFFILVALGINFLLLLNLIIKHSLFKWSDLGRIVVKNSLLILFFVLTSSGCAIFFRYFLSSSFFVLAFTSMTTFFVMFVVVMKLKLFTFPNFLE